MVSASAEGGEGANGGSVKKSELAIFSGKYSTDMWEMINKAKSAKDLRRALYCVCCRLQELESRMEKIQERQIAGAKAVVKILEEGSG